ncbi:MAG TPA: enoyl-CoA hydratase/isomerase family protein, partial [Geobacteraceae bacterium]|nr:enoyl-CoA hydratase/isomerase family protein [Geobacteraceae bacterium]
VEENMPTILIENRENIAVLTLNNGVANAINPELVQNLSDALDQIRNDAKGIVLCGGEKFFSIGLDLPVVINFSRKEMSEFWFEFNCLLLDLCTISLPTVCALTGHAVAGGNILALTGDLRFADSDTKKIGMNEIKLGVPVPYLADMMLRQVVGERSATQMICGGEFMVFSDAEKIGLIDKIFVPGTLVRKAVEKTVEISELQAHAFSAVKSNRTEEIKTRFENNREAKHEMFLDCWFNEGTRRLLQAASQKF